MKKLKGFTLIELIVGMGIMVILLSFVMVPWISGIESFSTANLSQQSTSAFIETYSRIDKNVRIAKEVDPSLPTVPPAGLSAYYTGTTVATDTMVLQIYQTKNCYFDYVVYQLKPNSAGTKDLHEIMVPSLAIAGNPASVPHSASDQIIMTGVTDFAVTPARVGTATVNNQATVTLKTSQGKVPRTIVRQQTRTMESRNAI